MYPSCDFVSFVVQEFEPSSFSSVAALTKLRAFE